MNDIVIHLEVQKFRGQTWLNGTELESLGNCGRVKVLGSERLATDPDGRDITATMRLFNLTTAVAPGEWPNPLVTGTETWAR
jgi:hypothetical protein